jgi:thiamine biosynthesis protein ThiS
MTGMREPIRIMVNGETRDAPVGGSVADLLAALGLPVGKVAVELNREIVPRSGFGARRLEEGDRLEIVHFVGGG